VAYVDTSFPALRLFRGDMQAKRKLPEFNERGVFPPGIYPARLDEFKRRLGFNSYRQEMIEKGLLSVLNELRDKDLRRIFVDGSFVTEKPFPGDIDAYVLVPDRTHPMFRFIAERHKAWRALYRIHCFPAIQNEDGFGSEVYWKDFFGHQPDQSPKGIVALELSEGSQ
jgi:hypothetical protein